MGIQSPVLRNTGRLSIAGVFADQLLDLVHLFGVLRDMLALQVQSIQSAFSDFIARPDTG